MYLNIVQDKKERIMNNSVTSKEMILENCRKLVSEEGLTALNMRKVAKSCYVALGSLYYYFPSKNHLMIETIESVWEDIFRWDDTKAANYSFADYIEHCYEQLLLGTKKYPNFFTVHSISFSTKGQNEARASMDRYLSQVKEKMRKSLENDKSIKKSAFSDDFKEDEFIDFVLSNIVFSLLKNYPDCKMLLEIIKRVIY